MKSIIFPRNRLFIFIISMFLFKPNYFGEIPMLDSLFNSGALLSVFILLFVWILEHKNVQAIVYVLTYYTILTISTIVNRANIWNLFTEATFVLGMSLMAILAIEKPMPFLDAWIVLFSILTAINLVTIIAFPDGLYISAVTRSPCFFLGHRNTSAAMAAAMSGIVMYRGVFKTGRITKPAITFTAFAYAGIVLTWSATALAACTIMLVLQIFFLSAKLPRAVNLCTGTAISIGITVLIPVLQMQQIFSVLIVDVLKKDLTLTGRGLVWSKAVLAIAASPWIGWGVEESRYVQQRLLLESAHNTWLDFLYRGGFPLAIAVVVFLIVCGRSLQKHRDHPLSRSILFTFSFFLVLFIAEPTPTYLLGFFFILLIFGINIDKCIVSQRRLWHHSYGR